MNTVSDTFLKTRMLHLNSAVIHRERVGRDVRMLHQSQTEKMGKLRFCYPKTFNP